MNPSGHSPGARRYRREDFATAQAWAARIRQIMTAPPAVAPSSEELPPPPIVAMRRLDDPSVTFGDTDGTARRLWVRGATEVLSLAPIIAVDDDVRSVFLQHGPPRPLVTRFRPFWIQAVTPRADAGPLRAPLDGQLPHGSLDASLLLFPEHDCPHLFQERMAPDDALLHTISNDEVLEIILDEPIEFSRLQTAALHRDLAGRFTLRVDSLEFPLGHDVVPHPDGRGARLRWRAINLTQFEGYRFIRVPESTGLRPDPSPPYPVLDSSLFEYPLNADYRLTHQACSALAQQLRAGVSPIGFNEPADGPGWVVANGEDLPADLLLHGATLEQLRLLAPLGVIPMNRDTRGTTPLQYAVWRKDPVLVDYLLALGADPQIRAYVGSRCPDDAGQTALDTVFEDLCACATPGEHAAMRRIALALIAAGGRRGDAAPCHPDEWLSGK